jgi:phage shock protein PspC (stress-responsive transcriptional regulator)
MSRRHYRYSLNRRDAKLVGVCSSLGERFGIDPTFLRIGFVAALIFIGWEVALVTYAALGIFLSIQRKREVDSGRASDFERMDQVGKVRPSTHALRTQLDETDRRLMAVDDHLNTTNHELEREIAALREEK